MTDAVGENDEELRRVERLPRPEKLAGKLRPDELRAAAGGAVHDQNGVARHALGVLHGVPSVR